MIDDDGDANWKLLQPGVEVAMPNAIRNKNTRHRAKSAPQPKFLADTAPFVSVRIDWTEKELVSLAKLASSAPAKPTEVLIRLMKG